MSGVHWIRNEEDFVCVNYGKMSIEELAKKVGKSPSSVSHKITRLRLSDDRRWTPDEDEVIKQHYAKCDRDLFAKLLPNRKYKGIKDRACRLGVSKPRKKWTAAELQLLTDNYFSLSNKELVELIAGKTESEIRNKAIKIGLAKPDNKWTGEEDDYLRANYLTEDQDVILTSLPNRNWCSIVGRATKLKLGHRTVGYRKYTFDYGYFHNIDTEEKAYWLGFIYADGSLSLNPHRLTVSLVSEGKKHLEKLATALQFSGQVSGPHVMKWKYKGVERQSKYFTLEVGQNTFIEDLVRWGVVPAKTHKVKFPQIETDLRRHFVRGVFDGDGCITTGNAKYKGKNYVSPSMNIVGAVPKFLEDIVATFVDEVGVPLKKVKKRPKTKSTWYFWYGGTPALHIRDWLYKDATVWMEYKKDKFFSFDYSSLRPRDKSHQEQRIDEAMAKRGWKRISEYKGYYDELTIQCDKGHTWTTTCGMFKQGKGCPHCNWEANGEKQIDKGKDNLARIFSGRGWTLLSDYVSDGEIQIRCEHGKVFTMTRRSAVRPHAKCDCIRVPVGKSGFRGVYQTATGRWQARIRANSKEISLGVFDTPEQANCAIEEVHERK